MTRERLNEIHDAVCTDGSGTPEEMTIIAMKIAVNEALDEAAEHAKLECTDGDVDKKSILKLKVDDRTKSDMVKEIAEEDKEYRKELEFIRDALLEIPDTLEECQMLLANVQTSAAWVLKEQNNKK